MVKFTKKIIRENFFEAIRKGHEWPKTPAAVKEGDAAGVGVSNGALGRVIAPVADVIGRSANMVRPVRLFWAGRKYQDWLRAWRLGRL